MNNTSKNSIASTMAEFYKIRDNLSFKCRKMTASELKSFLKNSAGKVLKELENR